MNDVWACKADGGDVVVIVKKRQSRINKVEKRRDHVHKLVEGRLGGTMTNRGLEIIKRK